MSTELVIGKAGHPHVHSSDFAQLIRGMFGNGRYRLKDRNNCNVTVSPGLVRIGDGGVIWNGRYIRNWDEEPYTYASPASTQTIGVFLVYTKDADTGIERCDFGVMPVDHAPQTNDNFSDLDLYAYTLFFSFVHNADGTISKETYHFPLTSPHEDMETLINTLQNAVKTRINERVLLAENIVPRTTVSLKESLNNFVYFELVTDYTYARYPVSDFMNAMRFGKPETRITIPCGAANTEGTVPYAGTRNMHIAITNNGKSLNYARGNTFVITNKGAILVYDDPKITKVYGVQRKW